MKRYNEFHFADGSELISASPITRGEARRRHLQNPYTTRDEPIVRAIRWK